MIQAALLQFPTKFGEISVLVFPAAKFPRPHQREAHASPLVAKQKLFQISQAFRHF